MPSFAQSTPDRAAQTLSVWEDIESVYVFGYQGVHSEALRRASEWVEEGACPSHVAWWIEDDVWPTWSEACSRHLYLDERGSSPHAFTLREPFDADGHPAKPDPAKINAHHLNSE